MANDTIHNHAELLSRITYLKTLRIKQEEDIKEQFQNAAFRFGLSSMFKGTAGKTTGSSIYLRMLGVGFRSLTNFFIDQIRGRRGNFKSFLRSMVADEFLTFLANADYSRWLSVIRGFVRSRSGGRFGRESDR
jgi:hypothetical protein